MATIRARYENGVLTPLEPLDIEEGREVDVYVSDDEQQELADTPSGVNHKTHRDSLDPFDTAEPPPGMNPTLWRIANIHKRFPPGSFDHIPPDLSVNIKHYIYGHPKVSEDE